MLRGNRRFWRILVSDRVVIRNTDGQALPTPFWRLRVTSRFNSIRLSVEAISFSCAAVLFLAVVQLGALAQDKRPAPVASQKRKTGSLSAVPTYSTSELDRASSQLPAKFKGNDIALVSRELSDRQRRVEKTEFETNEQWQHRRAILWSRPIVGRMSADSTWTFPLETVPSLYDVEKQVLDFYLSLSTDDLHDEVGRISVGCWGLGLKVRTDIIWGPMLSEYGFG
jgi:hypothetical protein